MDSGNNLTIVIPHVCRLKKGKQLEKEEAISEVKKNIHLIKAPHAGKFPYGKDIEKKPFNML